MKIHILILFVFVVLATTACESTVEIPPVTATPRAGAKATILARATKTAEAGSAATAEAQARATETAEAGPEATAGAQARATATAVALTPTITPLPTPDFEALLPDALKLCELSVDKRSAGKLPGSKVFVLIGEQGDWELKDDRFAPAFMEPRFLSEVAALVCIGVDQKKVGRYSDGEAAYRIYWNVQVVSWPDGQQIASKKFEGGDPPTMKYGSDPASGWAPYEDYQTWLKSLLPPPREAGDSSHWSHR